MVRLVALLEPAQDRDRVRHGGLSHEDGLEAPLERRVLLDVLAVLVQRRRADGAQLATREHRLQQVCCVHRTLGRSRADDRVQLVDEEDDPAGRVLDLRQDGLEPLLELAAVLRPGEQRTDVERPDALAFQSLGDVAGDDALREPLCDRGLADSGLADEHRVVLRPPREHLDDATDLLVAPDDGVELSGLGERGQVAAVLLQSLIRAFGILRRHLLAAAHARERFEQCIARHDVEREQEVLDRDELVVELPHLVGCAVEHAGESRRGLRLPAPRDGRQLPHACFGLGTQRAGAVARTVDERPRELLVEQRDREVIRRELRIARAPRELLRRGDGLLRLQRELLKVHVISSGPDVSPTGRARPRACTTDGRRRSPRAARVRCAPFVLVPCSARPGDEARARPLRG